MPQFSEKSADNLYTCHEDLILLAEAIIPHFDISVSEGHRGKEEQDAAYELGRTKLRYPGSKHNTEPSKAAHFIPYPFHGWDNKPQFIYMAGYVMAVADQLYSEGVMQHRIRWGGNWDQDNEVVTDQGFDDLAHFELVEDE